MDNIECIIPEGYKLRPLKVIDLENGLIELLSQLTIVGDVSGEDLFARYSSMAMMNPPTYYITVIEDLRSVYFS